MAEASKPFVRFDRGLSIGCNSEAHFASLATYTITPEYKTDAEATIAQNCLSFC